MTPRDATWLAAAREARGYTFQSDAIRALARRGIKVDPSTFSAWESGARKPKPSNRTYQAVVAFFGEDAQQSEKPGGIDTPAGLSDLIQLQRQLVTAFEVQANAVMDAANAIKSSAKSQDATAAAIKDSVMALVDEMRQTREAEVEDLLARMRVLEATVRTYHPPEEELASEEQSAHREGLPGRRGTGE